MRREKLYCACLEVVTRAAENGVCDEYEAWHMTPEELSRKTEAYRKAQVRGMKELDMLAWLVGQYVAVGVNSPGRYPRQPDRVRERAAGDNEMRCMLKNLAQRCGKDGEDR